MDRTDYALDRGDRRAIITISWLSAVAFTATILGLITAVVVLLTSQNIAIPGILLPDASLLPDLSSTTVSASASVVDMDVTNAPGSVRIPLIGAAIAAALAPLSITVGIFLVGRQIARQRFKRSLAITAGVLAVATFASGLFAPFLNAIAGYQALHLGPLGEEAPFAFTLGAEVLTIPALLIILSALLFVSERLQRDTEGLV